MRSRCSRAWAHDRIGGSVDIVGRVTPHARVSDALGIQCVHERRVYRGWPLVAVVADPQPLHPLDQLLGAGVAGDARLSGVRDRVEQRAERDDQLDPAPFGHTHHDAREGLPLEARLHANEKQQSA